MHTARSLSVRRYGAAPGRHSHGHFQILLGLSGALDLVVEGRDQRVMPGDGCVIAPGDWHDFESTQGSLCLVLDTTQPAWAQCTGLQPRKAPAAHALPLAQYLASAVQQGHRLAQTHGPALLLEAWLSHTSAPALPALQSLRRRTIDWTALQQWVAQQWHNDLTVADLAARVHLSPGQFSARCRDDQGLSAMAWLRHQRLVHAKWLRSTGVAVGEVARRTGYRSPSALTAALKRCEANPEPDATLAPISR